MRVIFSRKGDELQSEGNDVNSTNRAVKREVGVNLAW